MIGADRRTPKFTFKYIGPFTIPRVVNANAYAYELDLPPQLQIHPVLNISRLEQHRDGHAAFPARPASTSNISLYIYRPSHSFTSPIFIIHLFIHASPLLMYSFYHLSTLFTLLVYFSTFAPRAVDVAERRSLWLQASHRSLHCHSSTPRPVPHTRPHTHSHSSLSP